MELKGGGGGGIRAGIEGCIKKGGMGKRMGVKIEIKRCEVGRESTGITGQAVVQGTEGFLSNV